MFCSIGSSVLIVELRALFFTIVTKVFPRQVPDLKKLVLELILLDRLFASFDLLGSNDSSGYE
jgi:hypothetical protein